ncbi:hypothetical protein IV203_026707 [Nitzschia inconspicua]|uniref:Uncharacterized protein n=1 Tax=Nitzschia inconspicua TaxID=303405 RepID=A0A9K3LJR5_9STRA|nr:hypothetical protein IV203_026707 [Nitzschia inconspicua]
MTTEIADNDIFPSRQPQVEEEEEIWVPLSMDDEDNEFVGVNQNYRPEQQRRSGGDPSAIPSHTSASSQRINTTTNNNNTNNQSTNSLQVIQRKLETKISIQNNLVNHPIDLFWKRFLINVVRELWTLEVRIRSGLLLLILGVLTRLFVFSFWYLLYPRVAIWYLLFLGGFVYLDPFDLKTQGKAILEAILNPEKAIQAIERLNVQHIRRLSVVLFLFPTLLEIRTLLFLSSVSAETEWMPYHVGIGATLLLIMLYSFHHRGAQPRDATYQGMLLAYGAALIVSLCMFNIRQMPFLAAPFLTATGTLLLTYQDDDMEWMSRVARHALRVSLRDVLASIGSRVNEDEMLQLAILRWISDFWASNPGTPPPSSSSTTMPPPSTTGAINIHQSAHQSSTAQNENTLAVSSSLPTQVTRPPSLQPQRDVQWEELLPMLNIEIDHMEDEAENLQSDRPNQEVPPHPNQNYQQQPQQSNNSDPFEDLKTMLMSLNVDDRAKPAVQAYRRAVEAFPPPKRWAVALSVVRRSPASMALVFRVIMGETTQLLPSLLFLAPFVVMEYFRILHWIASCQQVVSVAGEVTEPIQASDWVIPKDLKNIDTMTILLCGDNHSAFRPPTLLRVWHNIASSVSALEVGLTAARCAETAAVAADFAGNVMSLVQFGYEVAEHGLLHGLGVVVKEAIYMGGDFSNLDQMDDGSVRYTRAAVQAIQSGHRAARNVKALSEDEYVGAFVQPIMDVLGAVIGHGWLWRKDEQFTTNLSTTVVIEEIQENVVPGDHTSQNQTQGSSRQKSDMACINVEEPSLNSGSPSAANDSRNSGFERDAASRDAPVPRNDAESRNDIDAATSPSPSDELSEVMEMVAIAYERSLIEDEEKADFYEKLSKLRKDELSDPSIVASMKRTLQIILDNGFETTLVETSSIEDVGSEPLASKPDADTTQQDEQEGSLYASSPMNDDSPQREDSEIPASASIGDSRERDSRAPAPDSSESNNNDALLKLGAVALGVIAGGVLLSMAGNGDENHRDTEIDQSYGEAENEGQTDRNHSSTVVIEELSEDDDEWVSVPQ